MTSTTNISLNLPTNGSYVNGWDVPVNANWSTIDAAIGGTTAFNVVGVSGTTNLIESQYGTRIWEFSGALTANITYRIPSGIGGFWSAVNNTSGAYTVTITSGGGGTSVVLAQGYTSAIICDGANVGYASTVPSTSAGGANTQVQFNSGGALGGSSLLTWNGSALTAPTFIGALTGNASTATSATTATTATNISGTVAIANGGTGATTAATALTALGAAPSNTTLGVGQTWQYMNATRSLGTTYTNSGTKPIALQISVSGISGYAYIIVNIGGVVFWSAQNTTSTCSIGCLIVPPGATYSASMSTGPAISYIWNELR